MKQDRQKATAVNRTRKKKNRMKKVKTFRQIKTEQEKKTGRKQLQQY